MMPSRSIALSLALFLGLFSLGCSTPQKSEGGSASKTEQVSEEEANASICASGKECMRNAERAASRGDIPLKLANLREACLYEVPHCAVYADALRDAGQLIDAREMYEVLCVDYNFLRGCDVAGRLYLTEEPADPPKAKELLRSACDKDAIPACYNLGVAIGRRWVEGSIEDAIALYEKSCDAEFSDGCQNLAVAYIKQGSPEMEARAIKLFEKNCAKDYSAACADLGDRYFKGRGVKKDQERALKLLEKACALEDAYGCAFLGLAVYRSARTDDRARRLEALGILEKSCAMGSGRGCLWAGEFAEEVEGSASAEVIEGRYQRAFAFFDKDCRDDRTGRSCGMAALMLEHNLDTSPTGISAKDYHDLGCTYDKRVCDWDLSTTENQRE